MLNPRNLVVPALFALLALAGCGDDDGPGVVTTDDYDAIDLDQAYGGLTMTDEQPAFDDPYLIADDGEAADDPLADDPAIHEMERRGQGNRFTFVRLVWGELDAAIDGPDGDRVDWTGSLHVDRGVLIVRRVIRFERPGDSLVRPRPDRQTVGWNSHTGGHFDGLLIQVIERPQDVEGQEPNLLHFATGPLTTSFPVADLAGLDQVIPVEPAGNAVHVVGFNLADPDSCPKGFVGGIWHANPDSLGEGGRFRGHWVGLHGLTEGYLRGRYGVNDAGERVFFGKYIGRRGQFRGLLTGTWQPGDEAGPGHLRGPLGQPPGNGRGPAERPFRGRSRPPGRFLPGPLGNPLRRRGGWPGALKRPCKHP